ncbi:NrdH-redoxin [Peribacillus cavernae]|uniref:NrdH-redoxin n=1 Tax=Peribacillus cavernae TaxID=1674310 RepID=A0A433HPM4_9BACI|nr:glutaredoxin domain-containing protein [Peribacillus cavernae]MDQ0217267.1 glutaredoxin-like YruB-family protein [Peribacillus cavernae]RUQ30265.1 NrdH-redoxin [Peribacillus cavernae]
MHNITVYTQPDCPPCKIVKMFLQEYNLNFTEKDIKADKQARHELTNQFGSYSTPTVVIDGEAIIGFDQEKLKKKLQISG